ncbi:heme ABC exporter ATP-binding protein CcmA [Pelagibacterium montanilacus]|uniref:heme ABC exporter ATP-binding protein CcmA n=1 Tax=Pelagibacterium montanilacus TaxID=2185280 RepID=UPI000F8D393B|nr:heme ABC exporter ATP-binding protein CcmA [Pelagibacterium montanilacus]
MDPSTGYRPVSLSAPRVSCVRGGRVVFEDVDLSVPPGSALVLRGPNGAGKSSALLTLAGLVGEKDKKIEWVGADPETEPRTLIHLVGHRSAVQDTLTVRENLVFWTRVLEGRQERVADALAASGLARLADAPCAILSAGQTRRLALARLVAVPRPVWLLDEPTSALDDAGARWVRELVLGHLARGGLAVAATHIPLGIEEDDARVRVLDLGGETLL